MFHLPLLRYSYDALEPFIDATTMFYHHDRHHRAYVDELNRSLEDFPEYQNHSLEALLREADSLPSKLRLSVIHNGGGHYNHSLFWTGLSAPEDSPLLCSPSGKLKQAIDDDFGSVDDFRRRFSKLANHHFASGWVWLSADDHYDEAGQLVRKLLVHTTQDHETPLDQGLVPLFVVDLWEHAFYLRYQHRRADFVDAMWNIIDWEEVAQRYIESSQTIASAA